MAAAVAAVTLFGHYIALDQLADRFKGLAFGLDRNWWRWGAILSLLSATLVLIGVSLLNHRIGATLDRLRKSEAGYRTMIQSMDEGVVVIDERGMIRSVNPAAEELFGYAEDELLGQNVKLLMPAIYAEKHDDYLKHYLETGEKHIIGVGREVHGQRRDGTEFPMQLFVSEMEFGDRRHFAGIVHDISERKKVEAEVDHARARAEQGAAAKSQFLANMSHEIRTPMNGVLGMLELLSESRLESAEKEYVHMARQSAVSLLKLIDDILDLSKIEAGRIELEREVVDLHELIEDAAAIGASLAIERDLRLNCYIAPDVPRRATTDPARLRQVLLNLLSNSVKFTDHGEVNLTAKLEAEQQDRVMVRFTVEDTGIGIEEAHLQYLFDPFVQADSSITRRFGGTGLGLTISRHLVELMGGNIQAESETGKGSLFTFTIQLGPPDAEPATRNLNLPDSLRVLVVDNNGTARKFIANYLREAGVVQVTTARNTKKAQHLVASARVEHRPFRLVLIKHLMPGAANLISDIRSDGQGRGTHVVAMNPVNTSNKGSKRLQVDRTLQRPVRRREMENLVAEFARLPQDATPAVDPVLEGATAVDWSDASVLLAEDHPVNQVVCQKMLERFGIDIEVVENGQQAVEVTARRQFDLVLMDCQMPVMDGYTAARMIRAREAEQSLSRTTIVAVTAHAMEGDYDQCLDAGMDDYIKKPYRLAELEAMLQRWLPTQRS